ncbi:lytic transglycosylase domain-containing protein [Pseudomonas luteola]
MDAQNLETPRVERSELIVQCVSRSALHFGLNPLLVQAIINVENGSGNVRNSDGTYDHGLMQINDVKFPEVKARFPTVTKKDLTNNTCINVVVGTWVLYDHAETSGSVWKAIAWYNSKTPGVGDNYRLKVIKEYNKLVKSPVARETYREALIDYIRLAQAGKAYKFDNYLVKR